jgi:hypothetical protein
MFSPFVPRARGADDDVKANGATTDSKTKPSEEITELKNEIEAMRKQLAELSQRK